MRLRKAAVLLEVTGYILLLLDSYIVIFPMSDANRNLVLKSIEDRQYSENYMIANLARMKQTLNMQLDNYDSALLDNTSSLLDIPNKSVNNLENTEKSSILFWELNKTAVKTLFLTGALFLVIGKIMRIY